MKKRRARIYNTLLKQSLMARITNLFEAITRGDLKRVRAILYAHGELVNERDESSTMPLHYAVVNGQHEIVRLLVEQGAEIASTEYASTFPK